jgi:hypothetical protein
MSGDDVIAETSVEAIAKVGQPLVERAQVEVFSDEL